ncbi:tyrosine-type recombinase/integrase [Faecousia sp.]|uniref:tyrosine-type recombinase/integrase n=1 Tax=Faecousia sp. TaxID=2952921 RepID=UPI003AB318CF
MPRKRAANGSGLQPRKRRDGRWEIRYVTGTDGRTGKAIMKSLYGKTSAEVAEKLREATASVDAGTYIEPQRMTLSQWLDIWVHEYCGDIKPGTLDDYKGHIENHIKPALGAIRLCDLQPHNIQRFANALKTRMSPKTGKPLAPKTIRNIVQGTLCNALSEAVRIRYLPYNPASGCVLQKSAKAEIQPLEGEEITQFIRAIKGNPSETVFFVALNTGMRLSEILGLRWSRINWKKQSIKVDAQLLMKRGKNTERRLGPPKNDKARTFKVAPAVMDALKVVRQQQLERKLKAGQAWNNPLDLVFTDEIGNSIPHATVEHRFRRIMQCLGLEHRFHDLRHTFACESVACGISAKTLSETLGHHSVAFTLDTYAHVLDAMQDEAAARMQQRITERAR